MYRYYTSGVCAKSILLDLEDDVLGLDTAFRPLQTAYTLSSKNNQNQTQIETTNVDDKGGRPQKNDSEIEIETDKSREKGK